jgi:FkbM family methyltransferase
MADERDRGAGPPAAGALRRIHRRLWSIRIGRCGPLARRFARALRRMLPVRGIGPLSSIVLGVPPPGRPCRVVATIEGSTFELDLRESLHRVAYLDLFSLELRRVVLPLLSPGELFVDAGANFGFWTVLAARRGCRVVSVEPVAPTRDLLSANVARNGVAARVEIVVEALSDHIGTIALAVPDGESGQASAYPDPSAALETHVVATTTLDRLLGESRARFLKVDVEGHEPALLEGARRVLAAHQVDYVLVELSTTLLARAAHTSREIVDLLVGHEYSFVRFVPANAGLFPRRSYAALSPQELIAGAHAGDALWRAPGA